MVLGQILEVLDRSQEDRDPNLVGIKLDRNQKGLTDQTLGFVSASGLDLGLGHA